VYLGTWNQSSLSSHLFNAIYGSRCTNERIYRRISKATVDGTIVVESNFNSHKTSCSHAAVNYIEKYRGMDNEQVNAAIKPLLKVVAWVKDTLTSHWPERSFILLQFLGPNTHLSAPGRALHDKLKSRSRYFFAFGACISSHGE
jgi:hypothetical protein